MSIAEPAADASPSPPPSPPLSTRRRFLRWTGRVAAGTLLAGSLTAAYGSWEASQLQIRRQAVVIPNLPQPFVGKRIVMITDLHLGPYVSRAFIERVVETANQLRPDAFALVGDFVHKGTRKVEQLPECLHVLERLEAPLGVFAVPGNHDLHEAGQVYQDSIRATSLTDLTNRSVQVDSEGEQLWFAGVDDFWEGKPDQKSALHSVSTDAAVVMLCHNPDFAEKRPDHRIGLMLSGHTHGGQVVVPGDSGLWIPSQYGDKYRAGLVQGPASQVYVSRGVGLTGVPVRINCPPEINELTLTAG
jgi:uncharacterized protein